jgi:hypothetical protein
MTKGAPVPFDPLSPLACLGPGEAQKPSAAAGTQLGLGAPWDGWIIFDPAICLVPRYGLQRACVDQILPCLLPPAKPRQTRLLGRTTLLWVSDNRAKRAWKVLTIWCVC